MYKAIHDRAVLLSEQKTMKPRLVRRNPGRMDGVLWNGDSFICANKVDESTGKDTTFGVSDFEDDSDSDEEESTPRRTDVVVTLLDMARPAKVKGDFLEELNRLSA